MKTEPEVGALAIPENAGELLSRLGQTEGEWDDLDDLDLVPPELRVAGIPFFKTNAKFGYGLISADGEVLDEVTAVLASRSISRSYFAESYDANANARPVCFSTDGVAPVAHAPERQAERCAGCPQSFEAGGDCRKNMEVLAYLDNGTKADVMRFRFGGLGFAPARRYWDSFANSMPRRHPIGVVTRITMEPTETPNGKFLVPRFETVRYLSRDQAEVFIADAKRRKTVWQQMVAEEAAVGDEPATPGPFDDTPHTPGPAQVAADPDEMEAPF